MEYKESRDADGIIKFIKERTVERTTEL